MARQRSAQPLQQPEKLEAAIASDPDAAVFGKTYVFRLRQHIAGPFPNLWELSILDPQSCAEVPVKKLISDADSLVFCLDNMQGELESDGL